MPTQEERLSTVEQAQVRVSEAIGDLNHYVTMLIGIVQRQEWDVREIKSSLRSVDGRLSSLEGRFETQEHRIESLDQSVNNRFEAQDKKLDQILLLLTTLTTKPE